MVWDNILRDRIIFGIPDNKVRERLLREPELNLRKALDICLKRRLRQWASSTHPMFTFSRKTRNPYNRGKVIWWTAVSCKSTSLSLSFVGSAKVNARPALLGASSMSSAAKRTILHGNAPFFPRPIKCHCLRKKMSCLFSKFSTWKLINARNQIL